MLSKIWQEKERGGRKPINKKARLRKSDFFLNKGKGNS
jgi:hypothetical protein